MKEKTYLKKIAVKNINKLFSVVLVLCLTLSTILSTANAAFSNTSIVIDGSIPYMIVNASGYVLDNRDSNPNCGTPAQIWSASMSKSEIWYLFLDGSSIAIKNAATGLLLETRNSNKNDWAEVGMWTDAEIPTQRWIIKKYAGKVVIINSNSGKKLSVRNGNFSNGTPIIQHSNVTVSEQWNLLPITRHEVYYKPVTGKVNVASVLNVRSGPDTGFPITHTLKPSTKISIVGRINDFYAIEGGGFVHCNYVNISKSVRVEAIEGMKNSCLELINGQMTAMNAICQVGQVCLGHKAFLRNTGLVAGSLPSGFATAGWNVLSNSENVVAISVATSATYFANEARKDAERIRFLYNQPLDEASASEIMALMVRFIGNSKAARSILGDVIEEYSDLSHQPTSAQIMYLTNFVLEGALDGMMGNLGNIDHLADIALSLRDRAGDTAVFSQAFLTYLNVYHEVQASKEQMKAIFANI